MEVGAAIGDPGKRHVRQRGRGVGGAERGRALVAEPGLLELDLWMSGTKRRALGRSVHAARDTCRAMLRVLGPKGPILYARQL